jgi:hypothetical protein
MASERKEKKRKEKKPLFLISGIARSKLRQA